MISTNRQEKTGDFCKGATRKYSKEHREFSVTKLSHQMNTF